MSATEVRPGLSADSVVGERNRRAFLEHAFIGLCIFAVALPLLLLTVLLLNVALDGVSRLGWDFLTSYPSRHPEQAGILPALVGTLWLMVLTTVWSVPVGIGTAIYLEEYAARGRLSRFIEMNLTNLAGVPSIIYGLLGLEVFVRVLGMGRSLLAGALTLGLLVLPVIVVSAREALCTVPDGYREAALGLGATKWRTTWSVVLPLAMPGALTGSVLAMSRAIGETAPLVVVGALTYVTFLPDGPTSAFTALPIQIFNWVSRPQKGFLIDAAAGICVLLLIMLLVNGAAIVMRDRLERKR